MCGIRLFSLLTIYEIYALLFCFCFTFFFKKELETSKDCMSYFWDSVVFFWQSFSLFKNDIGNAGQNSGTT